MLMRKTILTSAAAAMLFFSANAYAKYYQVTDTATGAVYFTKSIHHEDCGAIKFRDARTDQMVTLQSTSVAKLTKSEYKRDLYGNP
jgi:hypothetical protein